MEGDYYKTKESVQEYIRLAEGVNGKDLINRLKKTLPLNSTLLELGSGPGSDWEILNQSFHITGSDTSTQFIEYLKIQNPKGEFLEIDAVSLSIDEKFDGIYSNKVLHHLNDEELRASILRQHEILNNRGILCHSFWKGEGSEIFKGLFVNYHLKENISSFFNELFEILILEDYAEFEKGDAMVLIGRKK